MNKRITPISSREKTTIIAALRLLQERGIDGTNTYVVSADIVEILYLGGSPPISKEEIDDLCERINCS